MKEVDCVIYAKAKAHKDKINCTISSAKAAKVGKFIHNDVCEPMLVTSIGGNCYFQLLFLLTMCLVLLLFTLW